MNQHITGFFLFLLLYSSTDSEEAASESSATSESETTEDSSSGYETDLDPAAKLLNDEVRSGHLSSTH